MVIRGIVKDKWLTLVISGLANLTKSSYPFSNSKRPWRKTMQKKPCWMGEILRILKINVVFSRFGLRTSKTEYFFKGLVERNFTRLFYLITLEYRATATFACMVGEKWVWKDWDFVNYKGGKWVVFHVVRLKRKSTRGHWKRALRNTMKQKL